LIFFFSSSAAFSSSAYSSAAFLAYSSLVLTYNALNSLSGFFNKFYGSSYSTILPFFKTATLSAYAA
jgi:hypothetical protein